MTLNKMYQLVQVKSSTLAGTSYSCKEIPKHLFPRKFIKILRVQNYSYGTNPDNEVVFTERMYPNCNVRLTNRPRSTVLMGCVGEKDRRKCS